MFVSCQPKIHLTHDESQTKIVKSSLVVPLPLLFWFLSNPKLPLDKRMITLSLYGIRAEFNSLFA